MTRRLISKENAQRGTTLPLLTACTKCRQKWLEDSVTKICVFCAGGKTLTIPVGEAVWGVGDD